MYKDEIISEVWANRKAYVEKHGHDIAKIIKALKKRQGQSGRTVIDRRAKSDGKTTSQAQEARN